MSNFLTFSRMSRVNSYKIYIFTFHTCDINVLLLLAFISKATLRHCKVNLLFWLVQNVTHNLQIFRKGLLALKNVHYKMWRLRHDFLNHKHHDGKKLIIWKQEIFYKISTVHMSHFVVTSRYPSLQYHKIHSDCEHFHVLYVYLCSIFVLNALV